MKLWIVGKHFRRFLVRSIGDPLHGLYLPTRRSQTYKNADKLKEFWHFADRAAQYIYLSNQPTWCTKFLFYNKFISCLYMFWAPTAHHQEVKIALHSLWYHYTYRWPSGAQVERRPPIGVMIRRTRGCVMQFWPPDDEHMCWKNVEAWNKLTVKQKFCASSWLITEINILSCTVSKMSKLF